MTNPNWRYGDAGDIYPVHEGDIWCVGKHHFLCGDITRAVLKPYLDYVAVDTINHIYADPPWNTGNIRGFYTKRGTPTTLTFEQFFASAIEVMRHAEKHIFYEIGKQNLLNTQNWLLNAGATILGTYHTTYYHTHKHPAHLVHCTFGAVTANPEIDFNGMDDEDTPLHALQAYMQPGETVMDFCAGRGLTSRVAHACGGLFYGIELNPRRMADGLMRLSAITGDTPQRLDNIYGRA